ncbi:MAG: hypothetical protein OIF58_14285 [Cohaesibacter sp.]|nr:hypothetical protein [Cohaesibacter sp.]
MTVRKMLKPLKEKTFIHEVVKFREQQLLLWLRSVFLISDVKSGNKNTGFGIGWTRFKSNDRK